MSKTTVEVHKCAVGPAVTEAGGGVRWVLGKTLSRRDIGLTPPKERRELKNCLEKAPQRRTSLLNTPGHILLGCI